MALVLLIGTNEALLEGIAQSLASAGQPPLIVQSIAQSIVQSSRNEPPLIAVLERSAALRNLDGLRVRLAAGGALVLYRTDGLAEPSLPPVLQRVTVADLTLPLERLRLTTVVQHFCTRARDCGRIDRSGEQERFTR